MQRLAAPRSPRGRQRLCPPVVLVPLVRARRHLTHNLDGSRTPGPGGTSAARPITQPAVQQRNRPAAFRQWGTALQQLRVGHGVGMGDYHRSTTVALPVDDLFEYLSRVDNLPQ
jgi:hypothetical protein